MPDRDGLIMSTLLDIKKDVGEIKSTTANQDKCIDQLQKDVTDLKKSRDELGGVWKVVVAISMVVSGAVTWITGHIGGLK